MSKKVHPPRLPRRAWSRRAILRGAGTVAIGLPFASALRLGSGPARVRAALPEPQVRAFNLFFGLGLPTPLQAEGFGGPMQPFEQVMDKIQIIRGINQRRADEGGSNAHFDGSAGAFTAEPPDGDARAGGPSLDQVLRHELYAGTPPPAVLAGTYFRRSRPSRYVHSWNDDGTAAGVMQESPRALFTRIFGDDPSIVDPDASAEEQRRQRLRRSVLDSVVAQYQFYRSEASGLGAEARASVANHLDKVREYEMRAFGMPDGGDRACADETAPGASPIPHGNAADPGGQGIDITVDELVGEFRLLSEIYALGIQCDAFRFGCLTFQAAGERIRLQGPYDYAGSRLYDFDDAGERSRHSGDRACSHEWWHEFRESNENRQLRAHAQLMLNELVRFLGLLDDPVHADENGLTILDNALITISTESGDGRHNDVDRELSGVFHAISGANERFKTGTIVDVDDAEGLDLYNTMLEAMGASRRLGPSGRTLSRVDAILR
jgi:hypothetical protein